MVKQTPHTFNILFLVQFVNIHTLSFNSYTLTIGVFGECVSRLRLECVLRMFAENVFGDGIQRAF